MADQITWTDKVDLLPLSAEAEFNKFTAATAAEIKSKFNTNAAELTTATSDIATLEGIAGSTPLNYGFESLTAESSPVTGKFRFNNAAPASVTKIMVNSTDRGFDQWDLFNLISTDSVISIQDRSGDNRGGVFTIDSVVDNTTWFLLNVTVSSVFLAPLVGNDYAITITVKTSSGAGTGTVTSVATTVNQGIIITGTPTVAPIIDLERTGSRNFIRASTDLEGSAIAGADSIIYNDATDSEIKKGLVSDLPVPSLGTLSTGIGLNGPNYDGTTSPTPWKVDYSAVSNNVIQSATNAEGTDIELTDVILYSDSSASDLVKRGLVSDIPFEIKGESIIIAASDETTDLTTGTAKTTFRIPYAFELTDVRASVTTAPTGSVLTVDINDGIGSILSTKITIDATEKTSTTAATPPVISDSSFTDDQEVTIDIDTIGSTISGAGLKVTLIGYKT